MFFSTSSLSRFLKTWMFEVVLPKKPDEQPELLCAIHGKRQQKRCVTTQKGFDIDRLYSTLQQEHCSRTLRNTALKLCSGTLFTKSATRTLLRNSAQEHSSGTLFRNSAQELCSGTLLRNSAQEHSSGTLFRNTAQELYSGTLFRNSAQEHCSGTLLRNTAQEHSSGTLLCDDRSLGLLWLPVWILLLLFTFGGPYLWEISTKYTHLCDFSEQQQVISRAPES